jgi:hypothetical protein
VVGALAAAALLRVPKTSAQVSGDEPSEDVQIAA